MERIVLLRPDDRYAAHPLDRLLNAKDLGYFPERGLFDLADLDPAKAQEAAFCPALRSEEQTNLILHTEGSMNIAAQTFTVFKFASAKFFGLRGAPAEKLPESPELPSRTRLAAPELPSYYPLTSLHESKKGPRGPVARIAHLHQDE